MRNCPSLWANQTHNLSPATFTGELDRIRQVEASLPKGMQWSEIAFLRIGHDCADAGIRKDELVEELPNYNRTQAQTCHPKLPYGEVDASRSGFRAQLARVLWIVMPEVPLNPTYRRNFLLDHEHVRRFSAIYTRTIFRFNTRQIILLVPPDGHVGGGEPFLDQGEVASFKWPEWDGSQHQIATSPSSGASHHVHKLSWLIPDRLEV
jgi:hypothetical protein